MLKFYIALFLTLAMINVSYADDLTKPVVPYTTPEFKLDLTGLLPPPPSDPELDKLIKIYKLIKSGYVDNISEEDLTKAAIDGMMSKLDPHSNYIVGKGVEQVQQLSKHSYDGIGVIFRTKEKHVYVSDFHPDNAIDGLNIKLGDELIGATDAGKYYTIEKDGKNTIDHIMGAAGTRVELTLKRNNKEFKISVLRKSLKILLTDSKILENGIVYIRLIRFGVGSAEQITQAFHRLENELSTFGGVKGIILDLRNDPGGLLDEGVEVSNLFVDKGLIVKTIDKDGITTDIYNAKPTTIVPTSMPLVVLINENSASASEIVSGALQALHRAEIIGTKSYGKGSVQYILPINDNSVLKLTIARYYLASGKTPDKVGIEPDISVLLPENYMIDPMHEEDVQMMAAEEWIKKH